MSVDAVLIAGPTASGKSAAATAVAARLNGIVINADSMQIYREARILTARPSDEDMARTPHALYGHVGVRDAYSVGRYRADATAALADARTKRLLPIFTGGTGLYFAALTDGLADIPPIPASVREAVRRRREAIGAEAFHAELAARDPGTRLRAGDTQRTLRAYEVIEATGKPLAHWQRVNGKGVLAGLTLARFVIAPPRPRLHARIDARFDRMLAEGALEEAAALADIDAALPAAKILGRRELLAAGAGQLSLAEAATRAKAATRQYAKRQLTWFRHRMDDWAWLEPDGTGHFLTEMLAALA